MQDDYVYMQNNYAHMQNYYIVMTTWYLIHMQQKMSCHLHKYKVMFLRGYHSIPIFTNVSLKLFSSCKPVRMQDPYHLAKDGISCLFKKTAMNKVIREHRARFLLTRWWVVNISGYCSYSEVKEHEYTRSGGCFINVSWALQNILSKCVYYINRISYENFSLKLYPYAQNHALGTRTKFQHELHTINVFYGIVYFREIIL